MLSAFRAPTVFCRAPILTRLAMASKRKASTDGIPITAAGEPPIAGGSEAPNAPVEGAPKAPKAKRVAKVKAPPSPPREFYDVGTMRRPLPEGGNTFKILSWNVAGLRALLKKEEAAFSLLIAAENPDVICLQEHKLQDGIHTVDAAKALADHLPDWSIAWNCSTAKKGYSGTAILSKTKPLSIEMGIGIDQHDDEGRVLTAEFPFFFLVNVYVPNSGEGLKRLDYRVEQWDAAFSDYLKQLEARGKPVIVTGDLNCAAEEIDIHNPKGNLRSAGFTIEERTSFAEKFLGRGFVDVFRKLYPDLTAYTYWSYRSFARASNKGWRLDYYLCSEELYDKVHDCYPLTQVMGSDHCPLGLVLKI